MKVNALTALALLAAPAASQTLVKDLNTAPVPFNNGSNPSEFTPVHGRVVFAASIPGIGRELFVSDGTAAGTTLLVDIYAGESNSDPRWFAPLPGSGDLVFAAITVGEGRELWRTDGTAAGTQLVKDINPGGGESSPIGFTPLGNELFFFASGPGGTEVWKTDGTTSGTQQVFDTNPVGGISNGTNSIGAGGDYVFYTARVDGDWGLWRTDGTAAETQLMMVLNDDTSSPARDFTNFNGELFFCFDDDVSGSELWHSDGTPGGTSLFVDLTPGSLGSSPSSLTVLGNQLLFAASDDESGNELWRTDGTAAGTQLVQDINPIKNDLGPFTTVGSSSPSIFATLGNYAYFSAFTEDFGREFWRSDGTEAGTELVLDIEAGPDGSNPYGFEIDGEIYLTAETAALGDELYLSDGTAAGTQLVADIFPGPDSSNPWGFAPVGDDVIFQLTDPNIGSEPWITDGTAGGTQLLVDLNVPAANFGSSPAWLTRMREGLIFSARADGDPLARIFVSDGTAPGTTSIASGAEGGLDLSSPSSFVDHDGFVTFSAFDPAIGRELWITDGSTGGTFLLAEPRPGPDSSDPGATVVFDNRYFFAARDDDNGRELWATDGTPAGTEMIKDIYVGSASSSPSALTVMGDRLFFRGAAQGTGGEIWSTDGTEAGTLPAPEVNPGFVSGAPSNELIAFNGYVYFQGDDGVVGNELWRTDGTTSELVFDIHPTTGSNPTSFIELNGYLIFKATEPQLGTQPWRTDGVTTDRIKIVGPQINFTGITNGGFHSNGQFAFFWVDNGITIANLFRTDGTAAGTDLVGHLETSGNFGFNTIFGKPGSDVETLLQMDDGVTGDELWISDGTEAGTQLLVDIAPGGSSSGPASFVRAGNRVYFTADDGSTGRELHAVLLTDLGQYVAEPLGQACAGSGGGVPTLKTVGDAVVGQSLDIVLEGGAPFSLALPLYSLTTSNIDFGGGCVSYLLVPQLLDAIALDGSGSATLPIVPVAGLLGVPIYVQDVVLDAGGSFLGLGSLTNAVEFVVGL